MSKKQKNETSAKAPVKLTRAEKKEIQAVIRKYKGDGKPHSAQASIPYEAMYQDGVCRVTPRTFSKCIEFTDISYQLAQADTKTAIFENLCDLYNYLDASIHVQFSFINRKIDPKQYAKSFEIRAQGDDFDDIRSEYSDILQDQLVNGNNGLMKRKFMTYTIEADSLKMARARLRRIETDLLGYFKSMGASAWGLDAKQRLEVMHSIFHPDGEPFSFDWKWLAPSGLSTKDFIAPSSFRFGNARMFGLGGKYGAVSFLQILSPELSDEMLADFLNTENGIVVNLHVQAIDQSDAIKTVKRKITDLDAMKIQEQKRAVRSGYDMDILPSDLATYGQDAKELLKTLQSRNERMFQLTFLVLNTADTRQKLENDVFWAAGIAQKYNCSLVRLDYQQEQGLMSSLPLGASHIQIERSLTTSSVAVFVPFVTQELFQGGNAMYYGINAKTGNMIMLDRKRARCPNGLKLGTPGSGKSMSCKSEILSVFLCTPDDVYICDPEAEYYPHASTPKEPTYYEIPPEALKDEAFAAMIAEAEKYVGYPYVWGGSSPSTSFDCSGFISWVINHSGWNVGRQTAQGLYNICTPVSPEQAKPGDLVFFVGTYDTAGMSHVGLYVGNSVMLHCGDPISYTNLNSSYWQQHFYCYGRLP